VSCTQAHRRIRWKAEVRKQKTASLTVQPLTHFFQKESILFGPRRADRMTWCQNSIQGNLEEVRQ
jgi:hypothetical protein